MNHSALKIFVRWASVVAAVSVSLLSAHAQSSPIISGISPSFLRPGTIVELTGSGFGSAPFDGTQVCFSQSLCTTSSTFSTFVKSWDDGHISVVVPYNDLPATGQMSVVFPTPSGGMLVNSPSYSFSKMDPVVSQTSTKTIVPGSTDLVITGQNFLPFTPGQSTICVNNNCLLNTQIGTNILAWSDTSITVRLPYVSGVTDFSVSVMAYDPLLLNISGALPRRVIAIPGFHYEVPPDPQIATVSPAEIYPGNSVIVLTGTGFGDSYKAGTNQICFGDRCMSDSTDIPTLLQSWTPTRIEVKAPLWLALATSTNTDMSVRVYNAVQQRFDFIVAPTQLTLKPVPIITQTVPSMDMGGRYLLRGRNLGTTMGQLFINGVPLDVRTWSDTSITFWVSDKVQSGDLQAQSATGQFSQKVPVTVQVHPVYSKDEFTSLMWYFKFLEVPTAWTKTRGNADVVVAVIDSGVDFTHEDLIGKSWSNPREIAGNNIDDDHNGFIDDTNGWNFVTNKPVGAPLNDHGTMVTSTIAAEADNYLGLAGIAPGVRIMNLQVTTPADQNFNEDYITLQNAQEAIKYAVDNGADIINLSFASQSSEALYKDSLAYAYAHGVLVVIASGNDGKNLDNTKYSPVCDDGSSPYALGVASLNVLGFASAFANVGSSCIDLYAPGEQIVVAAPGGRYMLAEGTSFSAPIVAATAALLESLHPDWNVAEIRAALISSADVLGNIPRLNVRKALESLKPPVTYTPDVNATGKVSDSSVIFKSDPIPVAPVNPNTTTTPQPGNTAPNPVVDDAPSNDGSARTFKDIPQTSVFYIPVTELSRKGVIQGYEDGNYRPLTPVNRAEFLKILVVGANITPDASKYRNCFPDVTTQWYAPYVCYAKEQGVVEGYPGATDPKGNRLFLPDQTINKVEALKVILSYNKVALAKGSNSYNDVEKGSWYYAYVTTAEQLALLDERFLLRPGDSLTRGVMAQIIYRLGAKINAQKAH